MEMRFWEDNSLQQHVKFESNSNDNITIPPRTARDAFYCEAANLNFATGEDDCMDYAYRKNQVRVSRQDPMSHRIIEKRRRDRMNNCLADLSRLIPAEYLKKGRGRVEKTEIIEMAIKHMKHLQYLNHYRLGYQECVSETMKFMVEVEGHFPREPLCVRLLGHLQQHCDNTCRATPEVPQVSSNVGNTEPKLEPNNNYDNETPPDAINGYENGNGDVPNMMTDMDLDMRSGECAQEPCNGYKYKNDIKLRFTQAQDNQVHHKKPKLLDRRNSTPISTTDNQTCSSLGSPNPHHLQETSGSNMIMKQSTDLEPWTLSTAPPPVGGTNYANLNLTLNGHNGNHESHGNDKRMNFCVPAFVLNAKGSFYIPLSLDYQTLLPFLGGYDLLGTLTHDVVLHPIAINVNFQPPPLNLHQQPKKHFDKLQS